MLKKGVYVIGFSYPVVPQGKARIRKQISAAHSRADLELAINAFAEVKRELLDSPPQTDQAKGLAGLNVRGFMI